MRLQKTLAQKHIDEQDEKIKSLINQVITKKHSVATTGLLRYEIQDHVSELLIHSPNSLDTIIDYIFSLIEMINHQLDHNKNFYLRSHKKMIADKDFIESKSELCRHALIYHLITPCIITTKHLKNDGFSIKNVNRLIILCQDIFTESHFLIREIEASFVYSIKSVLSSSRISLHLTFTSTIMKYNRLIFYFDVLKSTIEMSRNYNDRNGNNTFTLNLEGAYHSLTIIYKLAKLYLVLSTKVSTAFKPSEDLADTHKHYLKTIKSLFFILSEKFKCQNKSTQLKALNESHNLLLRGENIEKYKTLSDYFQLYYPDLVQMDLKLPEKSKSTDLHHLVDLEAAKLDVKTNSIVDSTISYQMPNCDIFNFPSKIESMTRAEIKSSSENFKMMLAKKDLFSEIIGPTFSATLRENITLADNYLGELDAKRNKRRTEKRRRNRKVRRANKEKANLIESENKRIKALEQCQSKKVTHQSLAGYQAKKTDTKNIETPWSIAIYQPVNRKNLERQLNILRTYRYNFSHQFMLQKYYQIWKYLTNHDSLNRYMLDVTQNTITLMLTSLFNIKLRQKLSDKTIQKINHLFQQLDEVTSIKVDIYQDSNNEIFIMQMLAKARRLIIEVELRLKGFSSKEYKQIDSILKKAERTVNSVLSSTQSEHQEYHDETNETLNDIKSIRSKLLKKKTISKSKRQIVSLDVKTIHKPRHNDSVHAHPEIDKKQLKPGHHSVQFSQVWIYQRVIRTHGRSAILHRTENLQHHLQLLHSALKNVTLPQVKSDHIQSFCSKLSTLILNYTTVLGKTINASGSSQVIESTPSINQVVQSLQEILVKGHISTEHQLVNALLPCLICDDSILIEKQSELIEDFKKFLKIALNKNGLTEKDAAFYLTGSTLDKFHPNFMPHTESDNILPDLDLTIYLWTSTAHNKLKQVVTSFKNQLSKKVRHDFIYSSHLNMYQCHNVSIDGIDIDLTIKCATKGQEHSNTFEHELALNISTQTLSLTNKAISYQEVFSKASYGQFDISEMTTSKFDPYTVAFVIKKSIQYISKYRLSPGPRTQAYLGTIVCDNYLLSKAMKLLLDKYVHKNGNIKIYNALLQYPIPITFGDKNYKISLSYIINLWLPQSQPITTLAYRTATVASSDIKAPSSITGAGNTTNSTYDIKGHSLNCNRRYS